ncbi:MAG: histidinol-phosphate transaminase [Peptococcaceae bacterium]|nr:histidinol-phosphate transaminase [Peptococcaceae bacterium]
MTVKSRAELENLPDYQEGKPFEMACAEKGIASVTRLCFNENPMGMSPLAREAIVDMAGKADRYPDTFIYELREKIAAKERARGLVAVTRENVFVSNGSDEMINLLGKTFLSSGDEAIIADPTFPQFETTILSMGARAIKVPVDADFQHDLDAMFRAITDKTKMIFLCNPNNPTGTYLNKNAISAFLAQVPEHILIVLDVAYCEYAQDAADYDQGDDYVLQRPNVIVLRTFSKVYSLAGLRVGYAIACPALLAQMQKVREPFNVNIIAQAAAAAALDDSDHVARTLANNEQGKAYLYQAFTEMGLSFVPTAANFILVQIGVPSKQAEKALLDLGIAVKAGAPYGLEGYLRVTIGKGEDNEKFIAALKQVLGK